jgi:UDP-3-O-[3-hydroxymyristoyl] N-acetylglucosamine deacetylase
MAHTDKKLARPAKLHRHDFGASRQAGPPASSHSTRDDTAPVNCAVGAVTGQKPITMAETLTMMNRDLRIPTRQQTLAGPFTYVGRGLHSGHKVVMRLLPAAADSGIRFVRTDVAPEQSVIAAHWKNVSDTQLCTGLTNTHGVSVHTVEHLLAALRGCEIDNAVIELDAPEVPIMDGSAEPFVSLIRHIGIVSQEAARRAILIQRPVAAAAGEKFAVLLPHPAPWVTVEIAFPTSAIGSQRLSVSLDAETFARDIAPARTFGFAHEIDKLRQHGLARGGSLRNAILIDGNRIVNEEGLRFHNEFVRHKILDCVGDLSLLGMPVIGHLVTFKCGHALSHELLRELDRERDAWSVVTLGEDMILPDTVEPPAEPPHVQAGYAQRHATDASE